MTYELPTLHQMTLGFNRMLSRIAFRTTGRRGPKEFQKIVERHYDLAASIRSFNRQFGAAPERRGNKRFVDQTTQLGRDVLRHTRELVSVVTGARPANITFYHASGTGAGEPLNYFNGLYHNYAEGFFHILRFGSFGDRIRLQVERAGAKKKTRILDTPYGRAPSETELTEHFQQYAGKNDTIAFTHLETSTAAQIDAKKAIAAINRVYGEKKIEKPLIIVDATSSPELNIEEFEQKGYRVAVYQGTVKPMTGEALEGIVYMTTAAKEEIERRRSKINDKQKEFDRLAESFEHDGESFPHLPNVPLYFDHMEEQKNQETDERARFTQPLQHWWGVANNLMHFLKTGLKGRPTALKQLTSEAFRRMDLNRRVVQNYVRESFETLGFSQFSQSPSTMLLSLRKPQWLQNPQELLDTAYNKHGVAFQVGYKGATPELWQTSIDVNAEQEPKVRAFTDIFRINTYFVDNPVKELKTAKLLVKSALDVARKHGHLRPEMLRQLKEIERKAFREAKALRSS